MRLVIAVPTFHRPQRLAALLPMLLDQADDLTGSVAEVDTCRIIVVDNDPDESGHPVVEAIGSELIDYRVERAPGISAVRNRLLDEAGHADVLVFIDDDETPHQSWLLNLVRVKLALEADLVSGGVVSHQEASLTDFVRLGGFFDRPHRDDLPSGTRIDRAATNNLLVDLHVVRRSGVRFDLRFGFTGGEDSMFTSQLVRAGARMFWCAEALVTDHVPADRATPEFVLRKARSLGNSAALVDLALEDTAVGRLHARVRLIARETARALLGSALMLRSVLTASTRHRAVGMREIARARGAFGAVAGRRQLHYGAVPGGSRPPGNFSTQAPGGDDR